MKLFITQLDNGYTLTITHPPIFVDGADSGECLVREHKERLVFETYEALMGRIHSLLAPIDNQFDQQRTENG